ncbi:MAG: hypothetical protein JSR44_06950 [Spirochaetes bacterium]|nr:hypothetical protein [Spirochaetota bacterium]
MKTLASLLRRSTDLRGWQLSRLKKDSREAYYVGNELETVRCNAVANYTLRVQTAVDDALMGESTARFQGKPASLAQLVSDATARARLVKNPAYRFAAPYAYKNADAQLTDKIIVEANLDTLLEYGARIQNFRRAQLAKYPLNSLELFFENYEYTIMNYRGLDCRAASTRVVCDYVLTSPDNRHEVMGIKKRRSLADLRLEEQFEADAAMLSDLESAALPPTGELPVVLAGDALDSLFDFFVAQLDAHALFNKYSVFEIGDSAVHGGREGLTLRSQPALAGGMHSYAFDDLGFKTAPVTLVENSIVKNFLIDGRYSDLLHLPQTSALTNIEVECGSTAYADFLTDGVLELSKFSTFQPNTISGAFSGEIRLGYLYKNGKKIPVKGGSVSGTTQAAFACALKSREAVKRATYFGPKGVFFERLTVAGA